MVVNYGYDEDVVIKNNVTNYFYGLNLYSNSLFNLARDISINYYNTFILSDKYDKDDFITFSTPVTASYPKKLSTTIQNLSLSAYGRGFWTDYSFNSTDSLSCSNSIFTNGTIYNLGSWNVYDINLLDENTCTISKYRTVPPFLSIQNQDTQYVDIAVDNGVNYVTFVSLSSVNATPPKFNYVYNRNNNTIIFFKSYNPGSNNNTQQMLLLANEEDRIVVKALDTSVVSSLGLYSLSAVFLLSYRDADKRIGQFTTRYNSYKKFFYPTTNTTYNESLTGLKNNYLISSNVEFADDKYIINFQPLKNQLDLKYNFTNNSSFSGSDFDNRDYQSIITGTNQELGFPDLTLTFYTYNAPLNFKTGALTYFHFPVSATPFVKLNVNDTKLAENGAFPASNPLNADKIFKKKIKTVGRDNIIDDQTGTYLCTWLYTSAFDSRPVWMDRYYNPNYLNLKGAFINESFVTTIQALSAQNFVYFDKISDLVFEPNATYSYYRISEKDIKRINETIEEKRVSSKELQEFDLNGNLINENSEKIDLKTSTGFYSQSLSSVGSFSYCFNIKSKDYKNKFGSFLISTYNNFTGFTVTNQDTLNNFNLLTSASDIIICDNEYNLLKKIRLVLDKNNLIVPDKICSIEYNNLTDGYYITSLLNKNLSAGYGNGGATSYYYISKLNSNFVVTNTLPLTSFNDNKNFPGSYFVSSNIDDNYYYALINNFGDKDVYESEKGYYMLKYPLSGFDSNESTASYLKDTYLKLNVSQNGVPNINKNDFFNYRYTYNFSISSNSIEYFVTDYKNNAIVCDTKDKPWYLFDNIGFHLMTGVGSLSGFNLFYDKRANSNGNLTINSITNINTDIYGNIYLISSYNNEKKLIKLDNKRVPIYIKDISSNLSLSANQFLDIQYREKVSKIESYPVVIYDDYQVSPLSAGSAKGIVIYDPNGEEILNKTTTFLSDTLNQSQNLRLGLRRSLNNNQITVRKFDNLTNKLNFNLYLIDTNDDREKITIEKDLSNLTNDDLSFCYTFNALNGQIDLYINSILVKTAFVDELKYVNCGFSSNISINTLNFLPNSIQKGNFYGSNAIISGVEMYSKALNKYEVRNLYIKDTKLTSLYWNVPAGKRNMQETIQQNFKFGVQDYKTNLFDILITGTESLNQEMKDAISAQLREYLKGNIPINKVINEIEIRNNE